MLSFTVIKTCKASDTLKVLSWNVYLIPKIYINVHNAERAQKIGHVLKNSQKDIIVLQELFGKKMHRTINDSIKDIYPYSFGPGTCGFYKLNSGVVIYSKYPISETKIIKYKHAVSVDRMAKKSAVIGFVNFKNTKIQIIGTHLQSKNGDKFSKIRFKQLNSILTDSALIKNKQYPKLLLGDLNIGLYRKNHKKLLHIFNVTDGPLSGELIYSSDPVNTLKKDNGKSMLDYILLDRNNNNNIRVINRTITRYESIINGKDSDLSDHYAVSADILIE